MTAHSRCENNCQPVNRNNRPSSFFSSHLLSFCCVRERGRNGTIVKIYGCSVYPARWNNPFSGIFPPAVPDGTPRLLRELSVYCKNSPFIASFAFVVRRHSRRTPNAMRETRTPVCESMTCLRKGEKLHCALRHGFTSRPCGTNNLSFKRKEW